MEVRSGKFEVRSGAGPLLLGLLAFAGWGQQPLQRTSISGTVTDRAGASVAAAVVELRNEASGANRRGITDEAGKYSFGSIAPGSYSLKVDADGFALSVTPDLRFLAGTTRSLDITLDRDAMRAPSEKTLVQSMPMNAANPLPAFMLTCTNLTGADVSPDFVPLGIRLDGIVLPQLGHARLGGSVPPPVKPGRWWRLIIELQPKGSPSVPLSSSNLGEPATKIRWPIDLAGGSHRVAFACGGAWSEDVTFTWRSSTPE